MKITDELRAKSLVADDSFRWLPGMRPLLWQPGHPTHLRPFPRADREYAADLTSPYPWWACIPDLDDPETVKALATLPRAGENLVEDRQEEQEAFEREMVCRATAFEGEGEWF